VNACEVVTACLNKSEMVVIPPYYFYKNLVQFNRKAFIIRLRGPLITANCTKRNKIANSWRLIEKPPGWYGRTI
jgi:hypothetical protein